MFDKYEIDGSNLIIYLDYKEITGLKSKLTEFLNNYKFNDIKKIILRNKVYEFAKIVILDYNISLRRAFCLNKYGISINLDSKEDK